MFSRHKPHFQKFRFPLKVGKQYTKGKQMGQVKPLNKVNMTNIYWVFSTYRALCLVL